MKGLSWTEPREGLIIINEVWSSQPWLKAAGAATEPLTNTASVSINTDL